MRADEKDARLGLAESSARVQTAERLAAEARIDRDAWLRTAVEGRVPKRECARIMGVAESRIYQILGDRV